MKVVLASALAASVFGVSVCAQPIGADFNDDGLSDYPVSIISYDPSNPDVGAARIWSGASKSVIHTIVGAETNTLFGWSTGSAGDINLDGKVDAADLQDSISQLGTNPQAIGVMPIADSNGDQIIDAIDIQVVVDGYGATTDIYEGLWDGSRLLSVAAGASGFGSTANISSNPFVGSGVCRCGTEQLVPGTFLWPILWEFSSDGEWIEFAVVPMASSVDEYGTVTTNKAGASSAHQIDDTAKDCQ